MRSKTLRCCQTLFAIYAIWSSTIIAAPWQTLTTLVVFNGPNGLEPAASFIQGRDGNLYGTTADGGGANSYNGLIFNITPTGAFTAINNFCGAKHCGGGAGPGTLFLGYDGNFYGATGYGGPQCCGSIFKTTASGNLTYMYFSEAGFYGSPTPPLIQASDGNFYGTTYGGGSGQDGTVFRISSDGEFDTLYSFSGPDGNGPSALVQGSDGDLYGTTYFVGDGCCGTVFKITLAGKLTTLYTFEGGQDGEYPYGVIQGTNGNFYGINQGADNQGLVYEITPQGSLIGVCPITGGSFPGGNLVQATDGNFYGTTEYGGTNKLGNIFMMAPNCTVKQLYSFGGPDGALPQTGLFQATNGMFYGMTYGGGDPSCGDPLAHGCGTAYSLSTGLNPFVAFVNGFGKVGQTVETLGQGFTGTTSVDFNGLPAIFTVVSDTYLTATVPAGATTGYVKVTTPQGTLTSNVVFRVLH